MALVPIHRDSFHQQELQTHHFMILSNGEIQWVTMEKQY
jgi:hypothetical protein